MIMRLPQPTTTKYNKGIVHSANADAKTIEGEKATSPLELMRARSLLSTLKTMKGSDAGQKSALTKAINHLSHAIDGAKVGTGGPVMPPFLNPPIFLPGQGPTISNIRPPDPTPIHDKKFHANVTKERASELRTAFDMMKPSDIQWTKGTVTQQHVGQRFAQVMLEDHRMTDGNALAVMIPLGALTAPPEKPVDPNGINSFYLQSLHGGRGGDDMMSGPFNMPPDIKVAAKVAAKAESIGEQVAEANGHHLSKSDSVFLRSLTKLPNGNFAAKMDVTFWLDPNKTDGHIKVELTPQGKIVGKGEFQNVRASDS